MDETIKSAIMPVIKLTDELKTEIRTFFGICKNKTVTAEKYQISIPTVYRVLSGKVPIRSTQRKTQREDGFFNEHKHHDWLTG